MASLQARKVTVRFGNRTVLDKVSISISPGEIVGLVGDSGSGKTTLGRVLSGCYQPHQGSVLIDDVPLTSRDRRIATIHQSPRFATNPAWTLSDIILEPCRIVGKDADATELGRQCLLAPELLSRKPDEVSDGQLQRACIARAFAQDPQYFICDEPTSALDPIATAGVIELIRKRAEQGTGILLISHDHRLLAASAHRVLHISQL